MKRDTPRGYMEPKGEWKPTEGPGEVEGNLYRTRGYVAPERAWEPTGGRWAITEAMAPQKGFMATEGWVAPMMGEEPSSGCGIPGRSLRQLKNHGAWRRGSDRSTLGGTPGWCPWCPRERSAPWRGYQ